MFQRTDLALAAYNAGPTIPRLGRAPSQETHISRLMLQQRWANKGLPTFFLAAGASSRYGASPPKQVELLPAVLFEVLRASSVDEVVVVSGAQSTPRRQYLLRRVGARAKSLLSARGLVSSRRCRGSGCSSSRTAELDVPSTGWTSSGAPTAVTSWRRHTQALRLHRPPGLWGRPRRGVRPGLGRAPAMRPSRSRRMVDVQKASRGEDDGKPTSLGYRRLRGALNRGRGDQRAAVS